MLRNSLLFGKMLRNGNWVLLSITISQGAFTLQSFHNKRNDGVWNEEREEITAVFIDSETDHLQRGILFGCTISLQGFSCFLA